MTKITFQSLPFASIQSGQEKATAKTADPQLANTRLQAGQVNRPNFTLASPRVSPQAKTMSNQPESLRLVASIGDAVLKSAAAAIGSAFSPTAVAKTLKLNTTAGVPLTPKSVVDSLNSFKPAKSIPHFKSAFVNCVALFVPHILAQEGLKRTEPMHKMSQSQQDVAAVVSSAALCAAIYLGPSVMANNVLTSGAKVTASELLQAKGLNNFVTTTAALFGREALDLAAFTFPKNDAVVGAAILGGAVLDKIHSSTSVLGAKPGNALALGTFLGFRALEAKSLLLATTAIMGLKPGS